MTSVGCGGGGGGETTSPTVPANDVAVIDDDAVDVPGMFDNGVLSKANFDRFFLQTAKQNNLQQVPQRSDPKYKQLKDQAVQSALQIGWIVGEGHKEGITFTDTQINQSLQQIKSQFKSQQKYEQARDQAGLTDADVLVRARLQLIQTEIQNRISSSVSGTGTSAGQQSAAQQAALSKFGQTFREYWRARTGCAPGY